MNMTQAIKDDPLPKLRERYACRQREGKTRMLNELCQDYGYERKYAIKLLGDGRLEQEELVEPVSALYRDVWGPLINFFCPA